jgi:hypothetical protein
MRENCDRENCDAGELWFGRIDYFPNFLQRFFVLILRLLEIIENFEYSCLSKQKIKSSGVSWRLPSNLMLIFGAICLIEFHKLHCGQSFCGDVCNS